MNPIRRIVTFWRKLRRGEYGRTFDEAFRLAYDRTAPKKNKEAEEK